MTNEIKRYKAYIASNVHSNAYDHAYGKTPSTVGIKYITERLALTDRTVRRMIADGRIPKPIRLPGRCGGLRWEQAEIEEWIDSLKS